MVTILPYQSRDALGRWFGGHRYYIRLIASGVFALLTCILRYCEDGFFAHQRPDSWPFMQAELLAGVAALAFALLALHGAPTLRWRLIGRTWLALCFVICSIVSFFLARQ